MVCFFIHFFKVLYDKIFIRRPGDHGSEAVAQRKRGWKDNGVWTRVRKKEDKGKKTRQQKKHFQQWELELWCGVFDLEWRYCNSGNRTNACEKELGGLDLSATKPRIPSLDTTEIHAKAQT